MTVAEKGVMDSRAPSSRTDTSGSKGAPNVNELHSLTTSPERLALSHHTSFVLACHNYKRDSWPPLCIHALKIS